MAVISTPYRNMANITGRPSSARILNLYAKTPKICSEERTRPEAPFFINSCLNNSIFLKHRLREDEMEESGLNRSVGTKVFYAFNEMRLDEGGKYLFIQPGIDKEVFHENFGMDPRVNVQDNIRDLHLLKVLDDLPSLDPFLMREKMRIEGYKPDEAYFELEPAEYKLIRLFVEREFTPLAELAYTSGQAGEERIKKLVDKMWDCRDLDAIKPLIDSLQIKPEEAREVLFAWKGFIYYKSNFGIIKDSFSGFQARLKHQKIQHFPNKEITMRIDELRQETIDALRQELVSIQLNISKYDLAYRAGLLRKREPKEFRSFLDRAPGMFYELGASIAAVKHAISYWDFRFGKDNKRVCDAEEFFEIMNDFRRGLRFDQLKKLTGGKAA